MPDDNRTGSPVTPANAETDARVAPVSAPPWYARPGFWRLVALIAFPTLSILCPLLPAPVAAACATGLQIGRIVDSAFHPTAAPASSPAPSWRADAGRPADNEPIPYPPEPGWDDSRQEERAP